MDWYQAVMIGERGKRRLALRPVIDTILARATAPMSTWEIAEAITRTGTQDPIHSAETAKRLSYDLLDIAPYFPQWCERGPETGNRRPWIWGRPEIRKAPPKAPESPPSVNLKPAELEAVEPEEDYIRTVDDILHDIALYERLIREEPDSPDFRIRQMCLASYKDELVAFKVEKEDWE